MPRDKRLDEAMTIQEAMQRTGWSRGPILRACQAGLGYKSSLGLWMVTMRQLESVGLGVRGLVNNKLSGRAKKTGSAGTAAGPAKAQPAQPAPAAGKAAPSAPSKPFADNKKQHLILVGDDSGSMQHLARTCNIEMEKTLSAMLTQFGKAGFDTEVTTYTFEGHNGIKQHQRRVHPLIAKAPRIFGHGSTPLNEALQQAIEFAKQTLRKGESTLIVAFTDGEETDDYMPVAKALPELLKTLDEGYTVTLAGPASVRRYADKIGLPQGNVLVWEQTAAGVEKMATTMQAGAAQYTRTRSSISGASASKTFYADVTTDLAALDTGQLGGDISSRFLMKTTEKEAEIEDLTVSKTKKPFINGQSFYQLYKKERVGPEKAILVRHRKTGAVYGGTEARKAIGLPVDGKTTAKVNVGNNAWFDIFIQSTHGNRLIPRGSSVLIDKTMTPAQAIPDIRA